MAYKTTDDHYLIEDLLQRREFKQYKSSAPNVIWSDVFPTSMIVDLMTHGFHLNFYSYQLFIQHFMNPNTPYTRLLLNHGTGTGKTLSSIAIALKFIDFYRRAEALQIEGSHTEIGSIFVIGFAEEVFHRDLLRYPELKFISTDEQAYRTSLRMQIIKTGSKEAMEKLRELEIKIRRRFNNRVNNGFFIFVGYKAFFNRMFAINPTSIKTNSAATTTTTNESEEQIDIHKLSEEELYEHIHTGKILINHNLLRRLENSLIICDEIHKVYNSLEKNNWGVAIQYALDHVPTLRCLFMSATPINNSPTEAIDLLNLLIPRDVLLKNKQLSSSDIQQKLKKNDFFTTSGQFLPGALERLGTLSRGFISFLVDSNPIYFPIKTIEGETIKGIEYLKFVRIPMSKFQYNTYKVAISSTKIDVAETLAQDSLHILDIVFPRPPGFIDGLPKIAEGSDIGLYQTQSIKKGIIYAPQAWKNKFNIDFVDNQFTGAFFKRSNLKNYSPKYTKMLDTVIEIVKNRRGKIFIFHPVVHISGVLLIQEILLQNGFLSETGTSNPDTRCTCGFLNREHKKRGGGGGSGGSSSNASTSKQNNDLNKLKQEIQEIQTFADVINIRHPKYTVKLYSDTISTQSDPWLILKLCKMTHPLIYADERKRLEIQQYLATLVNKLPIIVEVASTNKQLILLLESIGLRPYIDIACSAEQAILPTEQAIFSAEQECKEQNKYDFVHQTHKIIYMCNIKTIVETPQSSSSFSKSAVLDLAPTSANFSKHAKYKPHADPAKKGNAEILQPCSNFKAARFILVHGEVDHMKLRHSIEKFNHADNTQGEYFMILVGAKKIQESYDLKAVREVLIVGRPDNIPTLKQVLGRAVRKNSHNLLPPEKRTVRIRIFTSCLPIVDKQRKTFALSYEEQKYMHKMKQYKIIQLIEKTFHENAVDAKINRSLIWPESIDKKYSSEKIEDLTTFDMLWFPPTKHKIDKAFVYTNSSTSTFMAFYARDAIHNLIWLIKRLFLEYSTVWTFSGLWKAVKNAPFRLEMDYSLFTEDMLIIALDMLIYRTDMPYANADNVNQQQQFTEPLFNYIFDFYKNKEHVTETLVDASHSIQRQLAINSILDPDERILYSDNNRKSVIMHIGTFYILTPLHVNPLLQKQVSSAAEIEQSSDNIAGSIASVAELSSATKQKSAQHIVPLIPILDFNCFYRKPLYISEQQISIDAFLDTYKTISSYEKQKERFISKWERVSINNMEIAICDFGIDFHERLIEECIEYIFGVWTGKLPAIDTWNSGSVATTTTTKTKPAQSSSETAPFKKSPKHNFIFKMIIYYGIRGLIIWAHTAKNYIYKNYGQYVVDVSIDIKDSKKNADVKKLLQISATQKIDDKKHISEESSGLENLLKSSINQSIYKWIPDETRAQYQRILEASLSIFDNNIKRRHVKPPADLLPVGHLLKNVAKFWYLHGRPEWISEPEYRHNIDKYVENDIIIGYDEKPKLSINIKFKIRSPLQQIKKFKDIRMVERGSVCASKPKHYLVNLAKKLDIENADNLGIIRLSEEIRVKLIYNELRERILRTKIKWFYFYYEIGGALNIQT